MDSENADEGTDQGTGGDGVAKALPSVLVRQDKVALVQEPFHELDGPLAEIKLDVEKLIGPDDAIPVPVDQGQGGKRGLVVAQELADVNDDVGRQSKDASLHPVITLVVWGFLVPDPAGSLVACLDLVKILRSWIVRFVEPEQHTRRRW